MNSGTLYWLTLNAYHEARGEPDDGIKAVCKVIFNRAIKRRKTVKEIIFAPAQFSWTGDNIPDHIIKEPASWKRCRELVKAAADEYLNGDTLDGADHYFNFKVVMPVWVKGMTPIVKIGSHAFYRS